MEQRTAIILTIIGFAAFIAFGFWLKRRSAKKAVESTYPVPIPSSFSVQVLTPGGVWVSANVDVPLEALQAIDAGIQEQLDRTLVAKPEWTKYRQLSDFEVMFIAAMAVNVETDPGSPALIVGGPNGIQASGTCIGTDVGGRPIIVVPDQRDTNWTHIPYLRESVRNESEHAVMAQNDRTMFDYYQGANDRHPIFP